MTRIILLFLYRKPSLMKRKLCFYFLFFLFLAPYGLQAAQTPPYFSNISLEDGLAQLSVLVICQDSKGYMWFGTRNGLNRYDGSNMVCYKHRTDDPASLVDNHIVALVEDDEQRLWIGSMGGLNRLDLRSDRMKVFPGTQYPAFSNGAQALYQDSRRRLWIGTYEGIYLYDPDREDFLPVNLSNVFKGGQVTCIYETSRGKLVFCTKRKGIYVCNLDLDEVSYYAKDSSTNPIPSNYINGVFEDSRQQIWLETGDCGLIRMSPDGDIATLNASNSPLTTNMIRCAVENDGTLYIGSDDGLYLYDLETASIEAHSSARHRPGQLSHFSVFSACVDRSGNLWVGTYAGGVDVSSKYAQRFSLLDPFSATGMIPGIIGPIISNDDTEGEAQQMYVATEGCGLLEYSPDTPHTSRYYLYDPGSSISSQNIIKSILKEGDLIWCGTAQGTLYRFNRKSHRFSLYHKIPQNRAVSIYAIDRDSDGNLWLATSKPGYGLIRLDKELREQYQFHVGTEDKWSFPSLRCLLRLEDDQFLIGSRHDGLYKFDVRSGHLTRYHEEGQGTLHLPANYVTSIVRDSKSHIWVSTYGGGISLFDPDEGVLKSITRQDGLADDEICTIVIDRNDDLWVSASNYISKYEPVRESIRNYQVGVLGTQEFTPHCGTLLPNGNICFSASNGILSFNPELLQLNPFVPPVCLTDLTINNVKVTPGTGSPLAKVLDETENLRLAHDQNNITIRYCALNFVFPSLNQYAVRLTGYDKDWNYVENRQEAYYTNLRPGKYVFEVKASNNDGLWNETPRRLAIQILPPVWATWYAYLFYALSVLGTLTLILYYISKKKALEQILLYKQKEQQRQEEFHQARMRMYTSFSHELRTPLTLIISPLEELLNSGSFNLSVKNKLDLIYNNAQRLLLLVNQLMDLRKSQAGKMEVKIIQDDLCQFVQEIWRTFTHIADEKNIQLCFEPEDGHLMAWYDKFLFEKLVFNLLSNALKNTAYNGHVQISVHPTRLGEIDPSRRLALDSLPAGIRLAHLTIRDDGCDIPPEEVEKIFEPFYQGQTNPSNKVSGTGIGLSLCQSVASLHHGTIWAENNPEGGACFHVIIPIDKTAFSDDDIETDARKNMATDIVPFEKVSEDFQFDRRYKVLLVEDNDAVRSYIKDCLERYMDVMDTDNGETALEWVMEANPDIVISDIMLPRKDGLELCMQIKENMLTGHIPVILMTAKSMAIHIIEGYSAGADDYIVKPFNVNVLISRIKNILSAREKMKELYGKEFTRKMLGIDSSGREDLFAQKLIELIKQNIANPELSIDMICREIGLSRANLYRKMKSFTELSPVELIRNMRLEMAADLLLHSNYTISEIATYTGFNSHAYFTSCFKTFYNCTPTEYAEQHLEQE